MKSYFITLVFLAALITSCTKDDDSYFDGEYKPSPSYENVNS